MLQKRPFTGGDKKNETINGEKQEKEKPMQEFEMKLKQPPLIPSCPVL